MAAVSRYRTTNWLPKLTLKRNVPHELTAHRSNNATVIGPNSLKKIESYTDKHGIEDVVKTYQSERQKYYEKLKHFKTFGRGWTRRVNETTEAALKLI